MNLAITVQAGAFFWGSLIFFFRFLVQIVLGVFHLLLIEAISIEFHNSESKICMVDMGRLGVFVTADATLGKLCLQPLILLKFV